jgi:hypothetical protein
MTDLLQEQKTLSTQFMSWFVSGLQPVMDDNRRRYRMKLADEDERLSRGLSALPSTKTTSVVDNYGIDALLEYHGEPDGISYVAKDQGDTEKDNLARWLTEIIRYRMEHTFPFTVWHLQSLKAGAVDGLEAAMVWWRHEAYQESVPQYFYQPLEGFEPVEVPEEVFIQGIMVEPEAYKEKNRKVQVPVVDTWWIDQLKPGENLLWDIKNPYLDLNSGQWAIVKIPRTVDEIRLMAELELFDKINPKEASEELKKFQKVRTDEFTDSGGVAGDPGSEDMDSYNRVDTWVFFRKVDFRWMVSFSVEGELQLSSEKPVDEVFFGGRPVKRLPVVLGCSDFELWEAIGRGLPKLIAPLEDEMIDQKNNANDLAKQIVQGRWRIQPEADIDLDSVLNARAFYAEAGAVEQVQFQPGLMESLRLGDTIAADIQELVPTGMESRQLVPKGTAKTLGATQMAMMSQDKKLSARLLVRNETFFRPLLYLIAQIEFAFETDETILRIAGKNTPASDPVTGQQVPFMLPAAIDQQGQPTIDLDALDFEVDIRINAGLGSVPKQTKAQKLMEIADWRLAHGVPTDVKKIADQLNVLAGFAADQFDMGAPPPQEDPTEYKVDVAIDYDLLPPQVQQALLGKIGGGGKINLKMRESKEGKLMREDPSFSQLPMIDQGPTLPDGVRDMTGGVPA